MENASAFEFIQSSVLKFKSSLLASIEYFLTHKVHKNSFVNKNRKEAVTGRNFY